MKNQTAVQWLIEQVNSDCLNSTFIQPNLIEQAKAMEKSQIVEAYKADMLPMSDEDGEQYYNETYGK